MCNVIPVKCKRVSTHTLMFWAGLGNVIFSFLFMPLPGIELDTLFHPMDLGKAIKYKMEFQSQCDKISLNDMLISTIFFSFIYRMVSMVDNHRIRIPCGSN